jgi:hypothetical protein
VIGWWIKFHKEKVPINCILLEAFLDLPIQNFGPKTKEKETPQ